MKTQTIPCKQCNSDFKQKRSTQVFCGTLCRSLWKRPPVIRECSLPSCSNRFTAKSEGDPKKYCSKSCSARYNNTVSPKRSPEGTCGICSVPVSNSRKYCTTHRYGYEATASTKIEAWLAGEWDGGLKPYGLSRYIRTYLLEKAEYCCEQCGFNTPHPSDGKTILEVDHIDGDGSNHRPENLRVLCPNCHALTPTYRARNMGRGRQARSKYYDSVEVDTADVV